MLLEYALVKGYEKNFRKIWNFYFPENTIQMGIGPIRERVIFNS